VVLSNGIASQYTWCRIFSAMKIADVFPRSPGEGRVRELSIMDIFVQACVP
jgi:hypothetical protein